MSINLASLFTVIAKQFTKSTLSNQPHTNEYYSCEWWEGGLTFYRENLHVCCTTHHGQSGSPIIAPYKGGKLPVKKIKRIRSSNAQKNMEHPHKLCAGCVNLRKWLPDKSQYLVNRINFSQYIQCNLKCTYCYTKNFNEKEKKRFSPAYDVLPAIEELIANKWLSPNAVFDWGGGEPTLLANFDKILKISGAYGVMNNINSNCLIFSSAIASQIQNGRANLTCSVDAGTPSTYKTIKGSDSFHEVWRNLTKYAEINKTGVLAKYIFMDINNTTEDIEGFVNYAYACGIPRIICDVNAEDQTFKQSIVDGIFKMKRLAELRNIKVIIAGSGIAYAPEKFKGSLL